MSTIDRVVAAGPDPEGAGAALERFREAGGVIPDGDQAQALLGAILASGSFLPDLLCADPSGLTALLDDPFLRRPKPRAAALAEARAAAAGARDLAALQRGLRRHRRREMLRLGARELLDATMDVARELSYLADACLDAAVAFADAELRAGFGAPASPEGPPSFVVMGMGKLGGEELNFSSDIDLIYVYSTDDGAAGRLTLHEYYARLAQQVTRAMGDITDEGLVFRVDLRLRPEGRSGAICNSLAAAESYYEAFGRTWERQALLRARPSAGDLALGERFLAMLAPFIYPRTIGPTAVDEVRALRAMFRATADGAGFDVKLGEGGIRDVELVAQLLQLLHAGKRRELRERGTLPALRKLALAGLLSDQEARQLSAAYRFLRRVEHRLQLEHAGQTHEMPAEEPGLTVLARRLGFADAGALAEEVTRQRAAVRAVADTLEEPEAGPPPLVLRLLDPAAPRQRLEDELRAAGFRDAEAGADALELARGRLPAEWLEEAIASPDPDRALGNFRDLALRGSLGLVALLREERPLLRMLASLFGTSERLSRHLVSHPAMWVPLFESLGAPVAAPGALRAAAAARVAGSDYESALRELRRYQGEEILRIGLHDVAGNLAPDEVSAQLSDLAEACLGETIALVTEQVAARWGRPDTGLTVLALGSFGAREMRYGSDLDLVFLYARPGATAQGMDHQEWFARLAQRVIGALSALLDEGRLYDVDTRLRPSGAQGMLVTTYAAFDRYHQDEAAPWERVALLRARPVYASAPGAGDPMPSLAPLLEEIAYRPVDAAALRTNLAHMRARIEKERAPTNAVHLRFSPGGLTDLEFLAAWGQLRHAADDPALRTTNPYRAVARLVERGELPAPLLEDYQLLQRASLRLRLLRDRPDDRLPAEDRPALARSLGLAEAELDAALVTHMARVRAEFLRALG